jgi:hypothetical protein
VHHRPCRARRPAAAAAAPAGPCCSLHRPRRSGPPEMLTLRQLTLALLSLGFSGSNALVQVEQYGMAQCVHPVPPPPSFPHSLPRRQEAAGPQLICPLCVCAQVPHDVDAHHRFLERLVRVDVLSLFMMGLTVGICDLLTCGPAGGGGRTIPQFRPWGRGQGHRELHAEHGRGLAWGSARAKLQPVELLLPRRSRDCGRQVSALCQGP